jgi:hypothetical protein
MSDKSSPGESRTAADWIAAFADELGVEAPDQATIDTLLDLAGVAAHSSERVAAPIACYLLGVAGVPAGDGMTIANRVAEAGR